MLMLPNLSTPFHGIWFVYTICASTNACTAQICPDCRVRHPPSAFVCKHCKTKEPSSSTGAHPEGSEPPKVNMNSAIHKRQRTDQHAHAQLGPEGPEVGDDDTLPCASP